MLNPYVPGGTSAKKTKLPADPTNDYIDEGQRAGPLDQPMAKPTVTPTFASQPVAKPRTPLTGQTAASPVNPAHSLPPNPRSSRATNKRITLKPAPPGMKFDTPEYNRYMEDQIMEQTGGGLVGGWQRRRDDDPIKQAWIAAGSPKTGRAYFEFVDRVREMQKNPAIQAYEQRVDRENVAHITSAKNDPRIGTTYGVDPTLLERAATKETNAVLPTIKTKAAIDSDISRAPDSPQQATPQAPTQQPRPVVTPNIKPVTTTTSTTKQIDPGSFDFTEDRLNNMLSGNSAYMRNARREGLDRAAERGGLNSSIAAGLSQREAIRAAAPIAQADAGFTQNRFMAGYNAQLEDTLAGNQMGRTMTRDSLLADLDSRRINQEADLQGQRDVRLSNLSRIERQFDATLTEQARDNETSRAAWLNNQTVLSNQYAQAIGDQRRVGLDFLSSLGAAFIDDPEVYSPEVVSGMSNFFNQLAGGMSNPSIQQILRDLVGTAVPPAATQPVQPVTPATGG